MAQVSGERASSQWLRKSPQPPAGPRKKVDRELERLKNLAVVSTVGTRPLDQPSPSSSVSSTMVTTPTTPTASITRKDDSLDEQQRQSSPLPTSTSLASFELHRTRARTLSGSMQPNRQAAVEELDPAEHDLLHMSEEALRATPTVSSSSTTAISAPSSTPTPTPMLLSEQSSSLAASTIDTDTSSDRERRLEQELKGTQAALASCQRQLGEQDRETQQILASCLAEKEQESVKVRKLLHTITLQEELIHVLQSNATATHPPHSPKQIDLQQLVADMATLAPEKDRLHSSVTSLRGELDMGQRQMNLLMMVSTDIQNAFEVERTRLEDKIQALTRELEGKDRLDEVRRRDEAAESPSLPIDHEVTRRQPVIEELSAANKRPPATHPRSYEPVENPGHRRRTSTSTFGSSNTEQSSAGPPKCTPFDGTISPTPSASTPSSQRSSRWPSTPPPPTPPPSEPLPPLPSPLLPFDKVRLRVSSLPRSRPAIASTPPSPRVLDRKHSAAEIADSRPSLPPFPFHHPPSSLQPFEARHPSNPASPTALGHSWYDDEDDRRSSSSTKERQGSATWMGEPEATTPTHDKSPFWKGMKKKWIVR